MQAIGVFKELTEGRTGSGGSLRDCAYRLDEDQALVVSRYLRSGVPGLDIMEATHDPLNERMVIPGGASLVSDGKWVWRQDLTYFVERYRVGLPQEFVRDVFATRCGEVESRQFAVDSLWELALAAYRSAEAGA